MKKLITLAATAAVLALAATPSQAGVTLNDIKWNGIRWNGVAFNALVFNGIKINGIKVNGVKSNELKWNGATATGAKTINTCEAKTDCEPGVRAIVMPSGERIALR